MNETRRRVLSLVAAGGLASVAGCTGGSSGTASGTEGDTEAPETETETQTETETETETQTEPEPQPMNTVFHFSSDGDTNQKHAVANVKNLLADESTDVETVALVANGRGLYLLTTESVQADAVESLADEGVSFRACENSMEALGVSEDELLDGVETVPAGVGELTKLQAREDYAYIKTP